MEGAICLCVLGSDNNGCPSRGAHLAAPVAARPKLLSPERIKGQRAKTSLLLVRVCPDFSDFGGLPATKI